MNLGKDLAEFLIAIYERFGSPFKRKPRKPEYSLSFVLVGPSGVGKTHISSAVSGDLERLLSAPERTYQTRELTFGDDTGTWIFLDTPGHREGELSRNEGLEKAAGYGDYAIVLVGANGYHESPSMERPALVNGTISEEWLEKNRSTEDAIFKKVIHRAMILKRPKVIVTLVNKADLWIDEWPTVKQRYERSGYHKEATRAGVQHEVLQYCVMPKKFWGLDHPQVRLDVAEAKQRHTRLIALLQQFAASTSNAR